ncbi:MAG: hypothetical protein ACU84H_09110 [Gammaproteobacteria bacterium]
MTPEQQREQWLKRILPALAVAVPYFVFVSGWVGEKSKKAEQQYLALAQKGISDAALPGMEKERDRIRADIAKLEAEDRSIHQSLSEGSGFLSGAASANEVIDRLTVILAEHKLQLLEEIPSEQVRGEDLSKSLRDTRHWLSDMLAPHENDAGKAAAAPSADKEAALHIRKIRFAGAYLDTYRAMSVLAESSVRALPVSLTMKPYGENTGKQEWVLKLWL